MKNNEQARISCFFQNWMAQQEDDLKQLIQAMDQDSSNDEKLRSLIDTSVKHFEEYHEKRLVYARSSASSFFSPSWCSSFENSYLWVGGCRPSISIRLIYSLCGSSIESNLDEFLQGVRKGNIGELSGEQLNLVNELQNKTIGSEDALSSKVASMQEEMADKILVQMSDEWGNQTVSDRDAFGVLDSLELDWATILEEADRLRLSTLREIVHILTPLQAMEFLISGKKLHLSVHQWCCRREHQHPSA